MRRIIGTVGICAMAGCVPVVEPDRVTKPLVVQETCGAVQRLAMIGQPVAALQVAGLPPGVRIIRPGDAITEDYSDSRLNVDLDAGDKVTRLWCG